MALVRLRVPGERCSFEIGAVTLPFSLAIAGYDTIIRECAVE